MTQDVFEGSILDSNVNDYKKQQRINSFEKNKKYLIFIKNYIETTKKSYFAPKTACWEYRQIHPRDKGFRSKVGGYLRTLTINGYTKRGGSDWSPQYKITPLFKQGIEDIFNLKCFKQNGIRKSKSESIIWWSKDEILYHKIKENMYYLSNIPVDTPNKDFKALFNTITNAVKECPVFKIWDYLRFLKNLNRLGNIFKRNHTDQLFREIQNYRGHVFWKEKFTKTFMLFLETHTKIARYAGSLSHYELADLISRVKKMRFRIYYKNRKKVN